MMSSTGRTLPSATALIAAQPGRVTTVGWADAVGGVAQNDDLRIGCSTSCSSEMLKTAGSLVVTGSPPARATMSATNESGAGP